MSASRAFPRSRGFRKLIFHLHFFRTRIDAQGLYWLSRALGDPSYNVWHRPIAPTPIHTMYGKLPHTMYEALPHTMYEALSHTMYQRFRTLTSWRMNQENQISTPRQKQSQNTYFRLWFCQCLARGDPWLFLSMSRYIWGGGSQCSPPYNVWQAPPYNVWRNPSYNI